MRRRTFVGLSLQGFGWMVGAGVARAAGAAGAGTMTAPPGGLLQRKIPHSGEALPVIGLGTWQTFDVDDSAAVRAPLGAVLSAFFAGGGRLIDSSPMYGRAEAVVGDLLAARASDAGASPSPASSPFLATKVWTTGKARGEDQMRTSLRLMQHQAGRPFDLMQIHNLVDWRTQLATLRDWKAAGRIRYIGVTHYDLGAFPELERIISTEAIDFIQLPYSIGVRQAEARLLPAAAAHATAVIVMRPFEAGSLFGSVRGRPLPGFAADLGCTSWAQLFLKFILAHPAVTCPIPATSNPKHVADNLHAGTGPLPDATLRKQLIAAVGA